MDKAENACEFTGNWLWGEKETPYTGELRVVDGKAVLSVEELGSASGEALYDGAYTTLWVGNSGGEDWPECWGNIDSVVIEPLD